tara:strand:- start:4 stop:255 length:252 start_codon:yes stop_codon:yes gene_type:complete
MENLENLITWVLGIAFLVYIALGNCCTDRTPQPAYSSTGANINAPALELAEPEMVVESPSVEVIVEEMDTNITETIIEDMEEE